MRIRQIRGKGYSCWPPVWIGNTLRNSEEGVLKAVALVSGTSLLKVDVMHEEGSQVGLLIFEQEILDPVYQKLKENIGMTLTEVGNLEVTC